VPRLRIAFVAALVIGFAALAPGQGQDNKQKFETKFEKDKSFYQKLTTEVEQTLKVQGGADVPLKHRQTFFFKWTPETQATAKDKDGKDRPTWTVKMTIEGVQFNMNIAQQTIDYDSTNPTAGTSGNPGLSDFFKNLVGAELKVTFGPGGVVDKVDGREELQKKLAAVNPQMEAILKTVLTDEALKEMTDPSLGLTPPDAKGPNESWKKTTTLSLGPIGSYERTFEYTYKGKDADPLKKDFDRVEVKPTLTYKPPVGGGAALPFNIKGGKLDTKEVKQGYILYDPKAGRVKEAKINVLMTGDLDVTIGTAETKVSLQQDQKTEVETSDSPFIQKKNP
jgi:hypothetical protein